MGTWIVTLFRGSLKHNGVFWGIVCIAFLTFDNDYLLGNIHLYSNAAYVKMCTCETCVMIMSNTEIALIHMQGVSAIDECVGQEPDAGAYNVPNANTKRADHIIHEVVHPNT